jgi:pimeloyl-ACP methyl ester carboxylesterase
MKRTPVEHHTETPFGKICWFVWGEAGEGPTLLLLHATGFHARVWDKVVAHLPDNIHVVAPDHLGHGRSDKPDSMANWTDSCLALLPLIDQLSADGRQLVAAGHSMGGYVLTRLAAERPQAFSQILLIDPVVLQPEYYSGAAHIVPDPLEHPVSKRRAQWASAEEMFDRFQTRPPYDAWDKEVLRDYCTYGLLPAPDGEGMTLACPPHLEAGIYQNSQAASPYDWADQITARTHIWRAPQSERANEMDFSNSPVWLGAAKAFHAETDRLWPDNSHFMPMEAPAIVAAEMAELLQLERVSAA